jgi:hypothetical protein
MSTLAQDIAFVAPDGVEGGWLPTFAKLEAFIKNGEVT